MNVFYTPNSFPFNNTITAGISNRDFTFHLPNGVKIYGGFNATETSIDQRDIASNPTILSGNIGNQSSSVDNVYHVVTSVLDNAETPFILQNVLAHPGNFLNFSTYGIQEQLPEN